MTVNEAKMAFGGRIYGLGIVLLGALCLVFREFNPGQPVAANIPLHAVLVLVAGAFTVVAGVAVVSGRAVMVAFGAAGLAVYYAVIVVILMNGPVLVAHYAEYGTYEGLAEQVAIAAAALMLFAVTAGLKAPLAARLTRIGQVSFGVCLLVFGGAHFVYMNLTAPLVPKWLPPSQIFWGYVTGVGFIAAGVAILTGVRARLAAIMLTAMLAIFAVLVHTPALLADHASHWNWTESGFNLVLTGAAWVVADSLARARR